MRKHDAVWLLYLCAASTIALLAGCKDAPTCPPQTVIINEGTYCNAQGMYLGEEVLVTADPIHFTGSPCEDATFRVVGRGYQACCEGRCCEWQPDDPTWPALPYQDCLADEDCSFGMTCNEEEAPNGAVVGMCRYAKEAEPCDYWHHCELGLSCNEKTKQCQQPITEEGSECDPEFPLCDAPLQCVCALTGTACRCFDGSAGDECETGTCLQGAYCAPAEAYGQAPTCRAGLLGDPCLWMQHCQEGLACVYQGQLGHCTSLLSEGQVCDTQAGEFLTCRMPLLCNDSYNPPLCTRLGLEGDRCNQDTQCTPGLLCHLPLSRCQDGMEGDPCEGDHDCAATAHCLSSLGECYDGSLGDPCEPGLCQTGLDCGHNISAPDEERCTQGALGDACSEEQKCHMDLRCAESDNRSYCVNVVQEGLPCSLDPFESLSICVDYLRCRPSGETLVCQHPGYNGESCGSAGDCAMGMPCVQPGVCSDGQHGSACWVTEDCAQDLVCEVGICSLPVPRF